MQDYSDTDVTPLSRIYIWLMFNLVITEKLVVFLDTMLMVQ